MARPIPRYAPVTTATRPSRFNVPPSHRDPKGARGDAISNRDIVYSNRDIVWEKPALPSRHTIHLVNPQKGNTVTDTTETGRARLSLKHAIGEAPDTLLGMNLDPDRIEGAYGIQSDRLDNSHFMPPADQMGIAEGWTAERSSPPHGGFAGQHFALVSGVSGPGRMVQMISNDAGGEVGIVQTNVWLRAGETLTLTFRAKAQFDTVKLRVGIRSVTRYADDYASEVIELTPTEWGPYSVRINVPQTDDKGVVFVKVQGRGRVWLDQVHLAPEGSQVLRSDFSERVETLRVPVVRFPGSSGITHHWRMGTGPSWARPHEGKSPLHGFNQNSAFGTDEYLQWCEELGIQPQITVNISTGSPEDASEWAAYTSAWYTDRELEPPIIYWQLGNEPWYPYDLAHTTPEWYAKILAAYVPGIRANYPKARIVAMGGQHTFFDNDSFIYEDQDREIGRTGTRLPWRQRFLDAADPEHFDVLGMQIYKHLWDEDPVEEYFGVFAFAEELEGDLQRAANDVQAHGLERKLALTEWNLWMHANKWDGREFFEPYTLNHVLYFAEVMRNLVRNGHFELVNFYCLNGPMRIFDVVGPNMEDTDLAKVYQLYRPALPGTSYELDLESPVVEGRQLDAVSATALMQDGSDGYLFLVNRDPNRVVSVDLDGLTADEAKWLEADSPRDRVSEFDDSAAVLGKSGSEVQLQPASVTRLKVHRS